MVAMHTTMVVSELAVLLLVACVDPQTAIFTLPPPQEDDADDICTDEHDAIGRDVEAQRARVLEGGSCGEEGASAVA